jgi:LysM repeat protein
MSRIANQYGVSLADLIAANEENIPNPDVLNIGDQVIIPQRPPDVVPGGSPPP